MRGVVGRGDEAEEEEDEVGNAQDLSQLLVDHQLPEGHLLLGVPPEAVPADDVLPGRTTARQFHTPHWEFGKWTLSLVRIATDTEVPGCPTQYVASKINQ